MRREEQGITLIALIITVIVMLILAGVVINLTIGENGILKKSDEGSEIYKNVAGSEANDLNEVDSKMEELMNKYQKEDTQGGTSTGNLGKPDENGIYTQNSTINGTEVSAFNPEIPKGFKPVDVDDAIWTEGTNPPTKDAVKAGLVIEDKEGNQFVWIAVDKEIVKLDRYTFAEDGVETAQGEKAILSGTYYFEELTSSNLNTVAKDINAFKASVEEHGGYYIARYEASYGVDNKPNSKVSIGEPNHSNGEANKPTQEGQLWNNITQSKAATVCRNMYDESYGAISDLANSYAWDTAIVFIQKYSENTNYAMQNGKTLNSNLVNTGTNEDEYCHIYDMGSNCLEWTTETSNGTKYPCVARGGTYYGGGAYTSNRSYRMIDFAYNYASFRPILYL